MSIRLNKALRELNIGLQTAVDFLQKKSELGEVKAEAVPQGCGGEGRGREALPQKTKEA